MRGLTPADEKRIARHIARGEKALFSMYKKSEGGGFGQTLALELLRAEGILATPATSPYVGQTGVTVFGGKRVQRRAERILFDY
jgi:hypothetical protein